jgi:ribosomal protein L44E
MKLPKTKKRYCKHCKKNTEQKVSLVKARGRSATHSMSHGGKNRATWRGRGIGFGNLGKWGSKPAISKFKRTGAKVSKKVVLKFTCKICGKSSQSAKGFRSKRTVFE